MVESQRYGHVNVAT